VNFNFSSLPEKETVPQKGIQTELTRPPKPYAKGKNNGRHFVPPTDSSVKNRKV